MKIENRQKKHIGKHQSIILENFQTNKKNIGGLRCWLNEERIDDPRKFVANAEIEFMLGGIDREIFLKKQKLEKEKSEDIKSVLKHLIR